MPLAESWPLEAGSCNTEKPNEPILPDSPSEPQSSIIHQQSSMPSAGSLSNKNPLDPIKVEPRRSRSRFDFSAGRPVRPGTDNYGYWSSSRHRPSNRGMAYSHLSDEELERMAKELG